MLVWLMTVAWGGGVFVNDVEIDPTSLAGHDLTQVTVRFDDEGNVYIDAPAYEVRLTKPAAAAAPTSAVPAGSHWLVTEDAQSAGHRLEVEINGKAVVTLASGEPQRVLDVSGWLQPGENRVVLRAESTAASGGNLYVYVGRGETDSSGTMVLADPLVEFGLAEDRKGVTEREFSFVVE